MKKIFANIRWISHAEGGRKTPIQPGNMYYPHISIDPQIDSQQWSVCFLVTPIRPDGTSAISFSLLVDNDKTNCFFSKLHIGMDFKFLEGNNIVAVGQILRIERDAMSPQLTPSR